MSNNKYIIFCEESYGVEGNTHQHVIDAIASTNIVYFVGPSLPFKFLNFFRKSTLAKLGTNVFGFRYKNFIPNPFPNGFLGRLILQINDKINYKRFLNLTENTRKDIIYFDPTKGIHFKGNSKYYYVLDPYFNRPFDKVFASKSTEVLVVNSEMKLKYEMINENIKVIPHGVTVPCVDSKQAAFLQSKYGYFALLMGTLSDLVDFDLLLKLVDCFPTTNFVLIGKTMKMSDENVQVYNAILKKNNVFHDGLINYRELDNYIAASKLCLIIYHAEKFKYKNPIKITNYLANRKLILNTFTLKDLDVLENKILYTGSNHLSFMALFEKAIHNELKIDNEFLDKYSQDNSYTNLVKNIFQS